jgi:hypothetical protein
LDSQNVLNVLDCELTVESSRELSSRLRLINFFLSNLPRFSMLTATHDKLRDAPDITKIGTPEHTKLMKQLQKLLVNSAVVLNVPNLYNPICDVKDSSA